MRASPLRRYSAVAVTLSLFLIGSIVAAPPALAYQEQKRTSDLAFSGDGKARTIFYFSTTLSAGQSKNFQAQVIVDGPDNYLGGQVDVAAGIGCYRPLQPGRKYYVGAWGSKNWIGPGGYPNPLANITLQLDYLFEPKETATYTYYCRLVVRGLDFGYTPQMKVKTGTWFRMSDGTYTDGELWSQSSPADLYVDGVSGGDPSYVYVMNLTTSTLYKTKGVASGRNALFVAMVRATTCNSSSGGCAGHVGSSDRSNITTRVTITRYNTAGTASCGQTTYWPTSGSKSWTIYNHQHHAILNHPIIPEQIWASSGPNGDCGNRFDYAIKITHVSGNPVHIEGGQTSTYHSGDGDATSALVPYNLTFAYGLTQG